jgi:uncharacterized protein (TIGR03083 family)
VSGRERSTDPGTGHDATEELIGAYVLDACDPDEAREVEARLAERPDLAAEAQRLANVAAWIGATGAVGAPDALRRSVLDAAGALRDASTLPPALRAYVAAALRLRATVDGLDPSDHDVMTPNGLSARDLVAHLAAQESLFAQALGVATVPEVTEVDVEARTAAFVARFDDLDDAVEVWDASIDAVRALVSGADGDLGSVVWLGTELPVDSVLVARAFENWLHRDDLREVQGRGPTAPPAVELHGMAELSAAILSPGLAVTGRARSGATARLVLTGPGGGEWLVPMDPSETAGPEPDVTLRADVVDWCRLVGERLDPSDLAYEVEGDAGLADDLIAAAPAFAML